MGVVSTVRVAAALRDVDERLLALSTEYALMFISWPSNSPSASVVSWPISTGGSAKSANVLIGTLMVNVLVPLGSQSGPVIL